MENQVGTLVTFGLIFFIIWFLMVRPQKKARQEHQRLVDSVEVGDEVMTSTGIFGTIRAVGDDEVKLEIAPGTEIRIVMRAILSRVSEGLEDGDEHETEPETEKETENA